MNLDSVWYRRSWVRWLLWPLSLLYKKISTSRKNAYLSGRKQRYKAPVPVIVVGNISVGGTGKTPLVIALAELLKSQGWKPAVISRGYKAIDLKTPKLVDATSSAVEVGDESLLIHQRTNVPVAVFPQRQAAIETLLATHDVDIIISDDGLQHYALHRDIEIAVVDAQRLHGNEMCLPAGPLREPVSRLNTVDFTVYNGEHPSGYYYTGNCQLLLPLTNTPNPENSTRSLKSLSGKTIHAIAGIGNPKRFFDQLRKQGINVIEHPFPDHHHFTATDLNFPGDNPVIMTEKDAVKCKALDITTDGSGPRFWYTVLEATLSGTFGQAFLDSVNNLRST